MREEATRILGNCAERRAVKALIELLLNEREDARVRKAAAKALGMIGDRGLCKLCNVLYFLNLHRKMNSLWPS